MARSGSRNDASGGSWAVALSYAAMMCLAIAINLLPVFLTTLGHDLGSGGRGLSNEQLGRIGAVTFVGLVLAILLTGPLADRLGPRRFAVLGNLLIGAGLGMLGLARDYATVLGAVFVMGFGAGTLDMVLSPIVASLRPQRRSAAMNWLHSFYCSGAVATVLAAALALRLGWGWRSISLWLVPMPLAVGLGFVGLRLPSLLAQPTRRTRLRDLWNRPFFRAALVAIFLGGATEAGMAQWLPAYAERGLGYSAWTGGMALLAFSVAMAAGRIAAGMLGTRVDAIVLMLGCCAASVALFLVGCFAPVPAVALGACVAAGLAGSCLWPTTLAVTADHYPRGGASMFALLAALGNLGGVCMPWVVGLLADHAPLRWGLATATLCPLSMLPLLWWMRRRQGTQSIVSGVRPERLPV